MHVYSYNVLQHTNGAAEFNVQIVGKNSRMDVEHVKGGTWNSSSLTAGSSAIANDDEEKHFKRPVHRRTQSTVSVASDSDRSELSSGIAGPSASASMANRPPTPASSVPNTPAASTSGSMHPPSNKPSSRRSSMSNTAGSPMHHSQHGRSPSPIPNLPAIKMPPSPKSAPTSHTTLSLYGGQEVSPFFRRLNWSPDGALLLTPAGLFEDPFSILEPKKRKKEDDTEKGGVQPTVYIYSRANMASPPVAHLPGHRTSSIAVRFSPVLWEKRRLKPQTSPVIINLERGEEVEKDLPKATDGSGDDGQKSEATTSKTESPSTAKAVFDLPYRMMYAVATHDTAFIYDTQQAAPICMLGNLHYAPFTDVSWLVGSRLQK
jgi:chromatin assembly factor 1 subunit B